MGKKKLATTTRRRVWPQSSNTRASAPLKTQSEPPLPLQQLTQILLPDGCVVEGEMAARLRRDRQQNEARVWHSVGLLLRDAKLGRIDEIIGGVDPKDWNRDTTELRGGIIASAGIGM